ncbi:NADPH-dependent 7-cyano-7-deazaguanine reductase QueF [Candidatus Marinamargulisbacteria bacterium SCGC AAA071-K20]|nr:NADPH-dependent 7-cyano-7-deazaguanine reductase QueF [Candidatus Marinamargulisbacteria bacterium SCGC AAA071-K20]
MEEKVTLGKPIIYPNTYNKNYLEKISRESYRNSISIDHLSPYGFDAWNIYEFSCLTNKNTPMVAVGQLIIPSSSNYIVESKSLKYYLNSFNMASFESLNQVQSVILVDLEQLLDVKCSIKLNPPSDWKMALSEPNGICLDSSNSNSDSRPVPELITSKSSISIQEQFYSHHFRSLCPVTGQPDWASIVIDFEGPTPDLDSLYTYITSFREHKGFHEQCVEKMYNDIKLALNPKKCIIYAYFLRRGGIDIVPVRGSEKIIFEPKRTYRQ